jgi:HlyD family secretion protein
MASDTATAAPIPSAVMVTTARAERLRVIETLNGSGSLVARRELAVGSELSGLRIAEVMVEEGQRVELGEVIARLDTTLLDLQLKQKEASVARATAMVAQQEATILDLAAAVKSTTADYRRAEGLRPQGILTQNVFDQREAAFRSAEAKLAGARQGLEIVKSELAQVSAEVAEVRARIEIATIRAPTAGLISRRAAEAGTVLAGGGDPLVRIIEGGTIEAVLDVPDLDLARVKPGQIARVSVAGDLALEGTVRLVAPTVDAKTRLGKIYVSLPPDFRLKPGAYAQAEIVVDEGEKLSIPLTAVTLQGGEASVAVIVAGKTARRNIKIGTIFRDTIEVLDGLAASDTVVLGGSAFLRDGTPVVSVIARDKQGG